MQFPFVCTQISFEKWNFFFCDDEGKVDGEVHHLLTMPKVCDYINKHFILTSINLEQDNALCWKNNQISECDNDEDKCGKLKQTVN